jgi:beta-glucosidase-like glycosyl hydrolase
VDSLLQTLSIHEKIGQLIMPWLSGAYAPLAGEAFDTATAWIDELGVGGIIVSIGSPLDAAAKLNALQQRSRLPLIVAADLEWGAGMRMVGATAFPAPMALGATGRELDAYQVGRVTALEARAVGIHWTFSPVADVNNNPDNPIINTRSFGESPSAIAKLITAYIQGATDHGLFTTAKHFPGHGDTGVDSHIDVPVLTACWARLDTLELVPFRAAIRAGVTSVMTAHIALPCFDGEDPLPATLSPRIMMGLLKDSLGFQGTVVTDALDMGAIVNGFGPGESAVLAFLAGSDFLLMPSNLREAVDAMVTAVGSGRIPPERLDRSVRRMLELKEQAGLLGQRVVPLDSIPTVVGHRTHRAIADDIAARSLTLVQRGQIDEIRGVRGRVAMIAYAEERNLSIAGVLTRELRRAGDTVTFFRLYPSSGPLSYDSARTVITDAPRVIFASSVRPISSRGHVALPDSLARLVAATSAVKPTVLVSFGSPYLLRQIPSFAGAYLLAWHDVRSTERAVSQALVGAAPITGRLPITLSERFPRGFGITVTAR